MTNGSGFTRLEDGMTSIRRTFSVMLIFVLDGIVIASGQEVQVPLHFGLKNSVYDERGVMLPGSASSPGALVQILTAPVGVYPPAPDGSPHTNNSILTEVRIGQGVDPAAGNIGKAAGSLTINRYQQNHIFARIFNRATTRDASFYVDSAVFTNSTTAYGVFKIDVTQTGTPLDMADDDGDGLINSFEISYGTDSDNRDSDGDGISDYLEIMAGTTALDDTSFLSMVELTPVDNESLMVQWESVPGKIYQVQIATQNLSDPSLVFVNVNPPVTATGVKTSMVIANGLSELITHIRVRLVLP
jgi:hypothetical protein